MSGLAGIGASIALKASPVGAFLKRIPRWVWIALAAAVLVIGGVIYHQHKAHQAISAAEKRGEDRAYARVEAKALKIAKDAAELSAKARRLNGETNRRIAADADVIRVRGPGKAACLNPATPGAGRYDPTARPGNGAGGQVPAGDGIANGLPDVPLAAVPWPWLVDRAEQCDLNRAEAETWRSWHRQLEDAWKKSDGSR